MGGFSAMTEYLNEIGFFTYLAFFLLIIVLYFLFEYLLRTRTKYFKERNSRKYISAVLSVTVSCLLYLFHSVYAGDIAAVISAWIFILSVLLLLAVLIGKFLGIEAAEFFKK